MKYTDIPQVTKAAPCNFHMDWAFLPEWLENEIEPGGGMSPLQIDPDFQRAHVWDQFKQARFVEHCLRGGQSSRDLYFNRPGWQHSYHGDYVLVDGKQRLEAVMKFLRGELAIFKERLTIREFEGRIPSYNAYFNMHINTLKTRAQVLQWYLDINEGGVVHTSEELDKVRELLAQEGQ